MNLRQLKELCWISGPKPGKPIRGVILTFNGLGDTSLKTKPNALESKWIAAGALVVHPYSGPWSWMNRLCRKFTDQVADAVYQIYRLDPDLPLIAAGGSMGGFSSLLYTRYAKARVSACLAVFPVTDLKVHFSERPDLPRTIHYAFRGYQEPYARLFKEHSPLAQAAKMPRIPYLLIHGDADKAVSKKLHSDPFAARMRKLKHEIEYMEVPGMGHGTHVPASVDQKQLDFVKAQLRPRAWRT